MLVLASALVLGACSGTKTDSASHSGDTQDSAVTAAPAWGEVTFDVDAHGPELLSDVGLFQWDGATLSHHPEAVEFAVNTPLFSDYALKSRAIWMPEGESATWSDNEAFDFPIGTLLAKSFLFPADLRSPDQDLRLIETRLLVHGSEGWDAWPYVWREDGTEADRMVGGDVQTIEFIDADGQARTANYLIPQRNQCAECHEMLDENGDRVLLPIGPKARNLHREGWLQAFVDASKLTGAPNLDNVDSAVDWSLIEQTKIDDLSPEDVDTATRDYLDVNCAHCHSPTGIEGITSQFFLNHDNEDEFNLGICKRPGSAGEGGKDRVYDIVPGDSYASILWYRTVTEDVGAMMPQLGRSLAHQHAADLIARWIDAMPANDCEG